MKKTSKIIIGAIVITLISLGCVTYFKNQSDKTKNPIKIGLSIPLTGEAASWGENVLAGAELAIREINEQGGVQGRLISLVVEDDKCLSKEGITAFNKLINIDQVTAIAGPMCSTVGEAALPLAQEAGVPTVIVSASATELTKNKDFIFRIYPADSLQGKRAASLVFHDLNKKKIAIVYVNNSWGKGIKDVFSEAFLEMGGDIVINEGINQDTKDLRTIIAKIKESEAEALYFPAYPANTIIMMKQARDIGLDIPIIGGDTLFGEEVTKSGMANGIIFTIFKSNLSEEFIEKIKQTRQDDFQVSFAAPFGYDAIKIIAEAMKRAKSFDNNLIKLELVKTKYIGASNDLIQFDTNGDLVEVDFEIKEIRNNKIENFIKNKRRCWYMGPAAVKGVIEMLANLKPENDVLVTTKTKHPQEHGEQEGVPRGTNF